MKTRAIVTVAAVLAFSGVSQAQLSPQEAQARLEARKAARATGAATVGPTTGPATRPAEDTELADLRRIIATLRDENASLKEEIAKLKSPKPVAPPVARATDRAIDEQNEQAFRESVVGMTLDDAVAKMQKMSWRVVPNILDKPFLEEAAGTIKQYRVAAGTAWNQEIFVFNVNKAGKVVTFRTEPGDPRWYVPGPR